jgi:hypothetical protein
VTSAPSYVLKSEYPHDGNLARPAKNIAQCVKRDKATECGVPARRIRVLGILGP